MKKTVTLNDFCDSFTESYKDNFSYEGKVALFNYLEEQERDIGEEMELDPIAFCCDFTEYENLKDAQEEYPNIKTTEDLQDSTQYIPVYNIDGTESERFILQNF